MDVTVYDLFLVYDPANQAYGSSLLSTCASCGHSFLHRTVKKLKGGDLFQDFRYGAQRIVSL